MAVLSDDVTGGADRGVDGVADDLVGGTDDAAARRRAARRRRRRTAGLLVFDAAVVVVFWLVAVNSVFPLSFWLRVPQPAVATVLGVVLGVAATAGAAWVHRAVRGDVAPRSDLDGEWDEASDDASDVAWDDVWDDEDSGDDATALQVVDLAAVEDRVVDLTDAGQVAAEPTSWGRKGVRRRRRR